MKKTYFMIVVLITLVSASIGAEQTPELTLETTDFTIPTEQAESLALESSAEPLGFAQNCLVTAPQCPTGSSACNGKPLGSACGNGGICFGLCSTPFVGTVCTCFSFGANAEADSEAAFLAELSSAECKATSADVSELE